MTTKEKAKNQSKCGTSLSFKRDDSKLGSSGRSKPSQQRTPKHICYGQYCLKPKNISHKIDETIN